MKPVKIRTILLRRYFLLSCLGYLSIHASKKEQQSLILTVDNSGGEISFTFKSLTTGLVQEFVNPASGEYIIPLRFDERMRLEIKAKGAKGGYKLQKKTIRAFFK